MEKDRRESEVTSGRKEENTAPSDRLSVDPKDLLICDTACQGCVYDLKESPDMCKKYPDGKPSKVLDPYFFCRFYSVIDMDAL